MKQLTYAQKYYLKKKAEKAQIVTETSSEPISFDKVRRLDSIHINDGMLRLNKTGLPVDSLFSYEGGIPVGTNIMCTGDPGVGKTTLLLHTLSNLQLQNKNLKCLFVCAEMSKIQMFKYMQRFPVFGNVETLFTSDYLNHNSKDVIEQLFEKGYDYVLIDSIVEVLEAVKEDAGMSQGQAEKWLIDLAVKNNEGNNERDVYTSFLLIQQVTKMGVFVGSNKLKHITDAHMEMKRESDRDGGGTYITFSKNRNGQAGERFGYQLSNNDIYYGTIVEEGEEGDEFSLNTEEE